MNKQIYETIEVKKCIDRIDRRYARDGHVMALFVGAEWVYTISPGNDGKIKLTVQAGAVTFFGAPGTKQNNMPILFDDSVDKFDADTATKAYQDAGEIRNDYLEQQKKG